MAGSLDYTTWKDDHKMETLAEVQTRWAHLSKKLHDPSVSAQGRVFIQADLKKLKPRLAALTASSGVAVEMPPSATPSTLAQSPRGLVQEVSKNEPQPISRDFDYYLTPLSQNLTVLIDRVFEQWTMFHTFQRSVGAKRLQEYRILIEGVILNVLYAHTSQAGGAVRGDCGVSVSRCKGDLKADSRYKPAAYTECLITVLDDLAAMRLLKQSVGERWTRNYRKEFGVNAGAKYATRNLKRTVIGSTDNLKELIETYQIHDHTAIGFSRERQEVIVQKADESSALIEYKDTDQTRKYRKQMQIINRMLEDAGPLLSSTTKSLDDRQRFLTRKFTYGNFESGGRLWGGFWAQHIRREDRPEMLRIHGERTVELDFHSMVVHLAYAMEGHTAPDGDQYAIPGLSPSSRPGIKKVLAALFFDKKVRTRFPSTDGDVRKLFAPDDQAKGYAGVFDAIKQHHSKIAHLFGQGTGHFLQFLESQVLVNALLYVDRMGLVALPLHDCLIARERDAGSVHLAMELATQRLLGRVIPIEIKGQGVGSEGAKDALKAA